MSAPVTAAEYKKGKTKTVKLSSGYTFEIRKIAVPVLVEMYDLLGFKIPEGTPLDKVDELIKTQSKTPESTEKIVNAIVAVVPHCVVKPCITKQVTSEECLTIDDIDPGDLFELYAEIMDFSGIGQMAEKLREKFRNQLSR